MVDRSRASWRSRRYTLIGGLAALTVAAVRAEAADGPLIGILDSFGDPTDATRIQRIATELGYRNADRLRFERISVDSDPVVAAAAVRSLLSAKPSALLAFGDAGTRAALAATRTVPVVVMGYDLVAEGVAAALRTPGGNVTGLSLIADELDVKRLEVLVALLPPRARVLLVGTPASMRRAKPLLVDAAARLRVTLEPVEVAEALDIPTALEAAARRGVQGVQALPSDFLVDHAGLLVQSAAQYRLPLMSFFPDTVDSTHGLIGYGPDYDASYRQLVRILLRVLSGAAPGSVPVEQPTHVTLAINLAAASRLGLIVPQALQLRADRLYR